MARVKFFIMAALIAILILPVSAQASFQLIESDGTRVVLKGQPQRVLVTSYSTALIMDALGMKLVGISTTNRPLPHGLQGLPQVGVPMRPDMEQIASLRPDLIIAPATFKPAQSQMFKQHGHTVYFIDNQRYTDTVASIEMFGKLFGRERQAEALVAGIRAREERVLEAIKGQPAPRVMIMFGTSESFQLGRSSSFVGDMVNLLKAVNVTDTVKVSDELAMYVPFSLETVVQLNPTVILRISHGNPQETQKLYEREFSSNPVWRAISAVRNNRVYDLPEDLFFANPGLRCIDALETLARYLYPQGAWK